MSRGPKKQFRVIQMGSVHARISLLVLSVLNASQGFIDSLTVIVRYFEYNMWSRRSASERCRSSATAKILLYK